MTNEQDLSPEEQAQNAAYQKWHGKVAKSFETLFGVAMEGRAYDLEALEEAWQLTQDNDPAAPKPNELAKQIGKNRGYSVRYNESVTTRKK